MKKYSKTWWILWLRYAIIRALRTVAQTAIGTVSVSAFMHEVNWIAVGSSALLAGIVSMLTSLTGLPELDPPKEDTAERQE